jgi:hypothetical protein
MPIELSPAGNGLSVRTWKTDVRYCPTCLRLTHPFEDGDTSEPASRLDISTSSDGMLMVSRRFREMLEVWGVADLEFRTLANRMSLMLPRRTVFRDLTHVEHRIEPPCRGCALPAIRLGFDIAGEALMAGQTPVGDMDIARIVPSFVNECGAFYHLAIGDKLWEKMRAAKVRGIGSRGPLEQPAPAPAYILATGHYGGPAYPLRLESAASKERSDE